MVRDQVFISYSHADGEWLERLQIMLAPLQRQGAIDVWADTCIQPGQPWQEEIKKALARAKVAVLLVSPDFLHSEFIHQDELPPLLEASRKEGLTILWVPVRPSLYKATAIAHFQAVCDPKTPLSALPRAQQEAELVRIAEQLMTIRPLPVSPPSPLPTPESTPTTPAAEQVVKPPSPPPSSPSPPPQATSPQRVWRQRLIVVVLSVLGGSVGYHLEKLWFGPAEKPPPSSKPATDPTSGPVTTSPPVVTTPAAPSTTPPSEVAQAVSLPPMQNIYGWSAQQVQTLQKQTAQALKQPVEFRDPLQDGSQGPGMVVIPGGRFQMGSPDKELDRDNNERQHEVEVAAFAISKHEVTFEEYDRFADTTGRDKPTDEGWGRGRRPVIHVSWFDAVAYAQWLSEQTGQTYRLPTEAEWEYACRAGTVTAYYFGETITDKQANYGRNIGKTVEVGQFPANAWGLYDMHGNVWEWTCSEYNASYGGAEQRCVDKAAGGPRVLRGGSWLYEPGRLRAAYRYGGDPANRGNLRGFRLARTFPF